MLPKKRVIKKVVDWRAILVDSFCQAGKTKKCFELLNAKFASHSEHLLIIFITQANNVTSANQTLQRARANPLITSFIPKSNILKSADTPSPVVPGNFMIVDYWNSRNTHKILAFLNDNHAMFESIIIVLDESDQAGITGIRERLSFVKDVEVITNTSLVCKIKVIFVTATVPNLSKSILHVANADLARFKQGVVHDIVNARVVEHHFARPQDTYAGASWFVETPNVWKRLMFPKKSAEKTKQEYLRMKENMVITMLTSLPEHAKQLTLIVTSTRTCEHQTLAGRLYDAGYNVTVELNGVNNRNFLVKFVNASTGTIDSWEIPYQMLETKADKGDLEIFYEVSHDTSKKLVESGIQTKEDFTLSHVLQTTLFMMTDRETRIKAHCHQSEFVKLEALSSALMHLPRCARRPREYPARPNVALIAGHLAGRGITIQNPTIDFICTSFCFTDTRDAYQRGATNTQRFGRACGNLLDLFVDPSRHPPILIATEDVIKDALANEVVLQNKADSIADGALICLKDMVSKEEWQDVQKSIRGSLRKEHKHHDVSSDTIDGVSTVALKHYFFSTNLLVGQMVRFLYTQDGKVTFDEFKQGVNYTKTDTQFQNNIDSGRSINSRYGKLWCMSAGNVWINERIKAHLDGLDK